jgi:hypothetical protein
MPMFFFDVTDGYGLSRDETGLEMPSAMEARQEAVATLLSIGRDRVALDCPSIAVDVRDDRRHVIFAAALVLSITVQGEG